MATKYSKLKEKTCTEIHELIKDNEQDFLYHVITHGSDIKVKSLSRGLMISLVWRILKENNQDFEFKWTTQRFENEYRGYVMVIKK